MRESGSHSLSCAAFERCVTAPVKSVSDEIYGVGIVLTRSTILWAQNHFRIRFPSKSPSPKTLKRREKDQSPSNAVETVYQRDKQREREAHARGGDRRRHWRSIERENASPVVAM
ncbi:hypothetical protein RHGRI_018334 [Rhododendron griersonianum]|uniref:Uncharacterized protein n=1 Tax=Rhododendron griersonianum TaxID=479676 RepID=A0AAV6K183_9ERIC|nr:hypothetical protein RHGRI_018334 [Rhododendron griersonianum]